MKIKKKVFILCGIIAAVLIAGGLTTYAVINSRTFQFFGGIVDRMETQDKTVALTFDDGPTQKTDQILSLLDAQNVKATFFLIGSEIKKYPDLAKKLVEDGQEIGNHTYSHSRMIFVSYAYVKQEIESTDELIRNLGFEGTIQFRPPNGKKLFMLPCYLSQTGRKTILWDLEPNSDPQINAGAKSIADYVVQNARPGSIILLHPMNDQKSIDALPLIIEGLHAKGYAFKTINELLGDKGTEKTP